MKYAAALEPVEAKVASWDFAAAWQAAETVQFDEADLAARLDNRRDEIRRMELLKRRIIAKISEAISEAKPPLKKSDLKIRGIGGEITDAGPAGLTTRTIKGEVEQLTWNDLGTQAAAKLMELVVDPARGEDCVAAALLAFAAGNRAAAERFFDLAKEAGTDVSAQLAAMAAATLAQASDLLSQNEFAEAASLLKNLQSKYSDLDWFESNRATFDAAFATATKGVREAEAEALYAEAVKFHHKEAMFDLREVVKQLNADYPDCRPVTESSRTPSVAELTEAVKDLGQRLVVRQDGKGDYVGVQAAIDAAEPNSLIEIRDNGPYEEKILIPKGKVGLSLRGAEGSWPIILWSGKRQQPGDLLRNEAPNTNLERAILLHLDLVGRTPRCLNVQDGSLSLRACLLYSYGDFADSVNEHSTLASGFDARLNVTASVLALSSWDIGENAVFENCLFAGRRFDFKPGTPVTHCSFRGWIRLHGQPCSLQDSILGDIRVVDDSFVDNDIERCIVYGESVVPLGGSCLRGAPLFRDPRNLDYRLMPGSPGTGMASDGGDVGCRYTPEMMEMCRIALELRAKGIIKF
jgi:hypothetical protein